MIIVEGPDGAGKTTLVHKLAQELGLMVGKRATDNRDLLYKVTRQDTYTALAGAVSGHEPTRIWDRLFFSELVYAPVMGREVEFSVSERVFVKRVLAAIACPIIVCYPPLDVVQENVKKQRQMEGVNLNITQIHTAYGTMFREVRHPFLVWHDYSGRLQGGSVMDVDQLVRECLHYLDKKKERCW
jgi:thymidylate kinase